MSQLWGNRVLWYFEFRGNRDFRHLRFWGTTENAVRIQIYIAISAYLLVSIVKHDMQFDRSIYEILQILSISLTDKTHLKDLFDKTIFKNDKDRSGSSEPNLFNF